LVEKKERGANLEGPFEPIPGKKKKPLPFLTEGRVKMVRDSSLPGKPSFGPNFPWVKKIGSPT